MPQIRLDKYISNCTAYSRSELKQMIRAGRVEVNGAAALKPELKLDLETAAVFLDGERLLYTEHVYYMLNKPAGLLSATDDGKQKTVIDLFPPELRKRGLFPVGRLDKDTTGLLLITDDGDFAHKLISPKSGIYKVYRAELDGRLNKDAQAAFESGITLADGTKCLPAKLEILSDTSCLVSVMEGKYHQVKRMIAACGATVTQLKRLSIGGLLLDEMLKEGEFRPLTEDELCIVFMPK